MVIILNLLLVLEVRLENQYYQVDECNDAVVEVCAIVNSAIECPITFRFEIVLTSSDGTAGNLSINST